jgi:ankyrin repeat protein
MAEFYKISCIDEKHECNIIDPLSKKLDFSGINPVSGSPFNIDDINSAEKRYKSMCLNRDVNEGVGGKEGICCDTRETRFTIPDNLNQKYKDKKIKVNREFGKIKSIDMCEGQQCSGQGWTPLNPYLMCKIGDNKAMTRNNILRFDKLNPDCYLKNCNSQGTDISFGNIISGSTNPFKSSYYNDLKLAELIQEDNVSAVKEYLDKHLQRENRTGANHILTDDANGDTLLLRAIRKKSVNVVSLLLSNNANPNTRTLDTGMTPLHYACKYGNESMLALLINFQARTDILDFKGRPPIFYAIMYGDKNMVYFLNNQNPSMLIVKDKFGNNALHIAIIFSNNPSEIVKYLLDNGINPDEKNNKGLTPMELSKNRIEYIKQEEENENTERFIEPFATLADASEKELHKNEVIRDLKTSTSHLKNGHLRINKAEYQGFISPKNNLNHVVEFVKESCYPYANIHEKEACEKKGGHWSTFQEEDMKTIVKIEYTGEEQDDDEDYFQDTTEKEKKKKENYYINEIPEPIPEVDLGNLDHDGIMGTQTPTPTNNIKLKSKNNNKNNNKDNNDNNDKEANKSSSSWWDKNSKYIWIAIGIVGIFVLIIFVYLVLLKSAYEVR